MKATVRLGTVAGVPIGAHWSALVIPALIADALGASILPATVKGQSQTAYWLTAAAVAFAFLVSLAAHEIAHAVVARRSGLTVRGITLWMLGGVTQIEDAPPTPRSDLAIAVVGPVTSFVCGLIALAAAAGVAAMHLSRVAVAGLVWLAVSNGLIAVFNMLPGAPLDGGRVLRALVWRRTGDRRRAEATATRAGRGTGIALIAVGGLELLWTGDVVGGLWLMLIGWFLITAATAEANAEEADVALARLTVGDVMDRNVVTLPGYQLVSVAARHAVEADVDFCPVTDFEGRLVGVVDVGNLVHAARAAADVTVASVMRPVDPDALISSGELLTAALHRTAQRLPLVVVDDGVVVGLVTPAVLAHALRRGLVLGEPVG
jgi:Zn-dependent protease